MKTLFEDNHFALIQYWNDDDTSLLGNIFHKRCTRENFITEPPFAFCYFVYDFGFICTSCKEPVPDGLVAIYRLLDEATT